MEILIREATPADAAAMVRYAQQIISEPNSNLERSPGEFSHTINEEAEILRLIALSRNSIFLIAEAESGIAGMLHCNGGKREATRHVVHLSMSVAAELRGQGIGTKLLTTATDWAKANSIISRMELSVFARNAPAIHLYRKFGFEEEGRCRNTIYRNGQFLNTLIMALVW